MIEIDEKPCHTVHHYNGVYTDAEQNQFGFILVSSRNDQNDCYVLWNGVEPRKPIVDKIIQQFNTRQQHATRKEID